MDTNFSEIALFSLLGVQGLLPRHICLVHSYAISGESWTPTFQKSLSFLFLEFKVCFLVTSVSFTAMPFREKHGHQLFRNRSLFSSWSSRSASSSHLSRSQLCHFGRSMDTNFSEIALFSLLGVQGLLPR